MDTKVDFLDIRALSVLLTRFPSVTESRGERDFAHFLAELIARMPWFEEHPHDVELLPIPGDPFGRSNVAAFVRGSGTRCIVLTGHYDVVETGAYGPLESIAFDPEALAAALGPDIPDIASGEFLPGRGLLDMKAGLAAGIAMLERFAGLREPVGNLLFLAVADEEVASHGMRAAAPMLRGYLAARGCEPSAVINLDAAVDQGSGEAGRSIFLGSVGKLLPFALFVGKSAHAGAPFDGVNSALLAADFVRLVEANPEALGEKPAASGEASPPPPTVLYLRETRTNYDVSTPKTVFCALNVLSHDREPDEVVGRMAELAQTSMERTLLTLRERASEQGRRGSGRFAPPDRHPEVIEFRELVRRAEALRPGILDQSRERALAAAGERGDPVVAVCSIVNDLAALALPEGPCAVLGFAPPYYPCARIDRGRDAGFLAVLRAAAAAVEREHDCGVQLKPYFPGISDMSFLAASDRPGEADYVAASSPLPMPTVPAALGCPVVNIGPWGREYHQAGERVHAGYAFGVLPELLWHVVEGWLAEH